MFCLFLPLALINVIIFFPFLRRTKQTKIFSFPSSDHARHGSSNNSDTVASASLRHPPPAGLRRTASGGQGGGGGARCHIFLCVQKNTGTTISLTLGLSVSVWINAAKEKKRIFLRVSSNFGPQTLKLYSHIDFKGFLKYGAGNEHFPTWQVPPIPG